MGFFVIDDIVYKLDVIWVFVCLEFFGKPWFRWNY